MFDGRVTLKDGRTRTNPKGPQRAGVSKAKSLVCCSFGVIGAVILARDEGATPESVRISGAENFKTSVGALCLVLTGLSCVGKADTVDTEDTEDLLEVVVVPVD